MTLLMQIYVNISMIVYITGTVMGMKILLMNIRVFLRILNSVINILRRFING